MRIITVEIKDGDVSLDLVGFHGKGCKEVAKAISEALGVVTKDITKPEYNECNVNTINK